MIITINEQPLDFALENETNLNEVVLGIKEWLEKDKYSIFEVQADGRMIDIQDTRKLQNTPIEGIDLLSFKVQSYRESMLQDLSSLYDYITSLKNHITNDNVKADDPLFEDFRYVKLFLDSYLPDAENRSLHSSLEHDLIALRDNTVQNSSSFSRSELLQNITSNIEKLKLLIRGRIREQQSPLKEALITAGILNTAIEDICDVSVLLQTGKDKEAMDRIVRFTEICQKTLRLIQILKSMDTQFSPEFFDGKTLEEFSIDLNSTLQELTSAFLDKDSILIGDLLEYEIAPRVSSLVACIKNLDESGE